jgi:hypothetical protein
MGLFLCTFLVKNIRVIFSLLDCAGFNTFIGVEQTIEHGYDVYISLMASNMSPNFSSYEHVNVQYISVSAFPHTDRKS